MDVAELVDTYGQSWNEPDEGARRKLLEAAWSDDGTYCDPTASVSGREELVAHISGMRQAFPDARIQTTSGVEEHHGWFRFAWAMIDSTGAASIEGFDVGSLGDDGRINRIVGFFGPFPDAG